ncbi:LTA synthase family protein [Phascolarctobacterium sp.]
MEKFSLFFKNLQQDVKVFIFYIVLFSIFRAAFIAFYSYQLNDAEFNEIILAMWYGARLSLKTAGMLVLIGAFCSTLLQIIYLRWPADKCRRIFHSVSVVFFTICFFARIPYYKIFNSAFDLMLINGIHDDKFAILMTAVNEYQLLWRLPAAVICGVIFAYMLLQLLKTPVVELNEFKRPKAVMVLVCLTLPVFCIFVRYGGAFSYKSSINWESAERLRSNLLNEAILDDGQALYRVRTFYKRLQNNMTLEISEDELREKIKLLGGSDSAKTIDKAFEKTVIAPKLQEQPQNVVLIIGESYALWPFLPEYRDLGLVEKGLKFQNAANGMHTEIMLAHGTGTMPTVNGFVTGLAAADLYENYRPESFRSHYATGIGSVMKNLGYKTVFWYGGFEAWQNIKNFVSSQNFDEFYCAGDFEYTGGNAWGCPDKVLFSYVENYIDNEKNKNEKVFHVILTSSNHPPYSIDVEREGFNKKAVKSKLPTSINNDDETLNELGHIWYADQVMGNFVENVERKKPDTLFVITGDHAERFNFAKEVDLKTLSAVPCIFYGAGIQKDWLHKNQIGCHMQIAPTLAQMVGKTGDKYNSIMPSLFEINGPVYNHRLWVKGEVIDKINDSVPNEFMSRIKASRQLTIWRVVKGNEIH